MSDLSEFLSDFFLFLESGFIAVNQADEDASRKLFQAAELLDPKNSLSKVGLGYMHLHKLEIQHACEYFEEVLEKEPHNEMAKTFLGLCLTMSPDEVSKGEKLLTQTSSSSDKLIKNLSHSALDFVDEFVKKEPTPVEIQKNSAAKGSKR
ncbi:MAG: hypothetical protein AAGI90_03940 [Chlamydiota bacterium]